LVFDSIIGGNVAMRFKKNLTLGIIAVVVAVLAYIFSYSQIYMGMYIAEDRNISPATFPRFSAVLLCFFGLANIIKSLVFKQDEYVVLEMKGELRVALCFLALLIYLLIFNHVGFIVASILLGAFVLFIEGCRKWQYYLIIAVITVLVFVFFRYGLKVHKLPWGFPLKFIFGGK